MKRQCGFTIIELMVTLAVLGILLTVAVPAFRDFVLNNRLTSQTNDLVADLSLARSEAARRGARVTVCVSSTGSSCSGGNWNLGRIVFVDLANFGVVDGGEEVLRVSEALPQGNALTSSGFTNAGWVQFRPTGSPDSSGTFKFCDSRAGNFGRLLSVSVTGRSNIAETSCP